MFESASSGREFNNDRFSPCSIRCMEAIITSRAQQPTPTGCFIGVCVCACACVCVVCICVVSVHTCVFTVYVCAYEWQIREAKEKQK